MTRKLRSWLTASLWFWAVIVAVCGLNSYWSESETWAVNVARHLFDGDPTYFFGTKPLLDLLLWSLDWVSATLEFHPIWLARVFMGLNFLLTLYLTRRLARAVWQSATWNQLDIWIFGLFLSHSFVVKRYIQVRSDLLATTLLLLWVAWAHVKPLSERSRGLSFLILALAAGLLTPKSIPLAIATFVVFELLPSDSRQFWLRAVRTRWGIGGCILSVLASFVFVYFHRYDLKFLIDSASEYDGGYWAIARWEHVFRAAIQNPVFTVAGLVACFLPARASVLARSLGHWATANLLILALYPDRFPFFIAALLPIFLLGILSRDWTQVLTQLKNYGWTSYRFALSSLQVAFVLTSLGWCYYTAAIHSSQEQAQWTRWFEKQVSGIKEFTLFDPDGLVPLDLAWHWFIGPATINNQMVEARLLAHPPDILLAVSRLRRLSKDFEGFVFDNYWTDDRGIFVRRWDISAPIQANSAVKCRDILVGLRSLIAQGEWPATHANELDENSISAYVEAILPDGRDITARSQSAQSDDGMVTPSILAKCDELPIPMGTQRIALSPYHIHSPMPERLENIFRFNSED